MRWRLALLLGAFMAWAGPGCRNCDLVEAELRTKEKELRQLREELHYTEACNEALEREIHTLGPAAVSKISPDQAYQTCGVKEIVLGRLTGGYDNDDCPGDEALQVVVEPRDPDGHSIKAAGYLHVDALEITPQGVKVPLSSWDVVPDQLRRTWHNGFLSTGYHVILPWKSWPTQTRLRVTARFVLPDDRVFEADRDVTIRLTPAMRRGGLPGVPVEELAPPFGPEPQGGWQTNKPLFSVQRTQVQPVSMWQRPGLAGAVQILQPVGGSRQGP
jgi:hypothetical protein